MLRFLIIIFDGEPHGRQRIRITTYVTLALGRVDDTYFCVPEDGIVGLPDRGCHRFSHRRDPRDRGMVRCLVNFHVDEIGRSAYCGGVYAGAHYDHEANFSCVSR